MELAYFHLWAAGYLLPPTPIPVKAEKPVKKPRKKRGKAKT